MAGGVAQRVFSLVKPTVEEQGVSLWDVRFVKEGASYYLRIFIDSERGITIDDCSNVSHAIDPILDKEDPIDKSYYLEVCSPGLERELTRTEHFEKMMGRLVVVKLYKAYDGAKEFCGTLTAYENGNVTVSSDDCEAVFEKGEISSVHLADI